jgi:hypothetical protein
MPPPKKNIKPLRRKPAARKKHAAPIKRTRRTIPNYEAQLWSMGMCESWSGLKRKYIVDLIISGKVPSVLLGPGREDTLPNGTLRRRPCVKYLVPSAPFKEFVEGLGTVGKLQRSA